MPKKSLMQKEVEKGEQLDLIDVAPKNAKPMIEEGRLYKKAQKARQKFLAEEVKHKDKIRQLAKDAGLHRLEDGVIRFTYDGVTICITPQDEKVTVKEEDGE